MDSGIKKSQVYMVARPGNILRGVGRQEERTSIGNTPEMLGL